MTETLERLTKLGFKTAAKKAVQLKDKARKLAIAYEHYRFVRQEKIDAFNQKMLRNTMNDPEGYKKLAFTSIEDYHGVPPNEVLDALETAQGRKCFDTFEVAYIKRVKDPILFGRVSGCPDRFYIAQWDDDVKITDLLKENEG